LTLFETFWSSISGANNVIFPRVKEFRHGLFSSVAGNQHNTVTTVTGTHFSVARDVIIQVSPIMMINAPLTYVLPLCISGL